MEKFPFQLRAQQTYYAIAAEMSKMSLDMIERRFRNLLVILSGKKLQNRNKQVIHDLVEKIRYELNTTKRQCIMEELLDEIDARLDNL